MPEYKKPEITRTQDIVVASTELNDYDDLVVRDTEGCEYKVSRKRDQLHAYFQIGAKIRLKYAEYKGVEYIVDAMPYDANVDKTEPAIKPTTSSNEALVSESVRQPGDKNRAFALSYAKDWAIALLQSGKKDVSGIGILQVAKVFENYLNTGDVPDSPLFKEAKKLDKEVGKEDI